MSDHNTHSAHGPGEGGHEKTDLNYAPMLLIIPACLAILVLFVTVVVFLTSDVASNEMTRKQYGGADAGKVQLHVQRAHEDSILTSTSRDTSGHLHIPVEQAIAILAAKKS